jgi:signal peptidase
MAQVEKAPATNGRRSAAAGVVWRDWLLVVGWLAVVVLVTGLLLPRLPQAALSLYLFQPLLWLSLAGLVLRLWRAAGNRSLPVSAGFVAGAALLSIMQIIIMSGAGFVGGFGASPYAHGMPAVVLNLWSVLARLAALELCRWFLVAALAGRRRWLGMVLAWALLLLAAMPVSGWTQLGGGAAGIEYAGRYLVPGAAQGLLATYLVVMGGPWASMAYLAVLQGFEWLAPILPDLSWPLAAFVGVVVPLLGLVFMHDVVEPRLATGNDIPIVHEPWGLGWVTAAMLALFLVWFNSGLFGIQPTLVGGPSMIPTLRVGDIAIVRDATAEEIKINDVIRFKMGAIWEMHRVVEIRTAGGQRTFITMGDNNDVEDAPVNPQQLQGKLIFIVPRLGWIPIAIHNIIFGSS